ncbi:hypothetical protein Tco_0983644 [Tanacetum coccineum]
MGKQGIAKVKVEELANVKITSSGWPFVSTVLGQMAHLVASITLDNARSYVMQSAFLTQGTVSSIPIIFSWSDNIRPEGFMSSVLLWLLIIVAVVGVSVTVVVVVESSSVSLRFKGGNIPFNTSRQSPDENFRHFLRIWHHSGTQGCQFLESSHICIEIIPLHSRMVKFVFHLLDLSSGTILLYQKLLEFNPVANFTLQSLIQLLRENTDSVRSNQRIRLTTPSVPLKLIGWQLMNSL